MLPQIESKFVDTIFDSNEITGSCHLVIVGE